MSKNTCPYCGGKKFYPAEDEGGYVRFICCEKCHATGPAFDIPQDCLEDDPQDKALNRRATRAFCHPAHLLHGKVMVGVKDASVIVTALDEYREMEMNSGKAYPRTPDWTMPQARIKAAIDAAGGGK